MTAPAVGASAPMPTKIDQRTRQRIAANLRRLKHEHRFEHDADMARVIGISRSALGRYLKGDRTVGLDVAVAIHRKLPCSLDWLIERDPPKEWWDPDYRPPRPKSDAPHSG